MIKNTFIFSLLVLTVFLVFGQATHAEARHHCRGCSSSSVGLNVSVGTRSSDSYVTRRYVTRPVVVPTAVVVPQGYAYAPVYAYQVAPVVPTYYEEVYVAPAPRRVGFSDLSFSWNFFK